MQAWLPDLTRPVGNIVHIGAGACSNLDAYLETGAQAIVLVDPSADEAAELEARGAGRAGVSVIEAAVSADGQERPFRRTNFPELDSFRAPTGLLELFPGLRILSEEQVTPMEPARVFDGLALDGEGSNLLVLETPGESLGILQSMRTAGLLRAFDMICLRDGREQLYAGAATMEEIGGDLAENGFSVILENEPEDPDRPYLLARQDRSQFSLEDARAARAASEAEMRDLARQNAVLRQQIEALQAELEQVRSQSQQIEELQEQRKLALQQVETANGNLSVALRMQALHRSDLEHLQERYAALMQQRRADEELMKALAKNLAPAARYLQEQAAKPGKAAGGKRGRNTASGKRATVEDAE